MLIFEKSKSGRHCSLFPPCDVEVVDVPAKDQRKAEFAGAVRDRNQQTLHRAC